MGANQKTDLPELGRGPRLFDGDRYVLTRKYGTPTEQLEDGLSQGPLILTVTGTSYAEGGGGDTYVRLHYSCPRGVYVETRRSHEMEAAAGELRTAAHRRLSITRKIGESFMIRPFRGKEQLAAQSLAKCPVLIHAEELLEGGDEAHIHILAADCWEILRTELAERPRVGGRPVPATPAAFSLEAFRAAAARVLPPAQLAEIEKVAVTLSGQWYSCRE